MRVPTFILTLFITLSLTVGLHALAEEAHRWVDADGNIHFSDQMPEQVAPETVQTQVIDTRINTFNSIEVSASDFLSAREQARADQARARGKAVVMYSAVWCGVCKKARRYFVENDIPFREFDVESSQQGREDFASLGGTGVPIILVDDVRMNGFNAARFAQLYRN